MRRPWGLPLMPLWAAGSAAKNWLYDRGWLRVRRLAWPVVSVGSLSAGGAGKTPVVLMLAELLARHGVAVDVLSRGYGRGSGVVEEVDPAGTARRFGDEPMELARAGLQVLVGAERFEAGRLAESSEVIQPRSQVRDLGHPASSVRRVHLLDDGFQHRRLGRALDLVLLTAEDVRDWLIPAGNLREGLRALGRADAVLVREDEEALLRPFVQGRPVWVIRRELTLPSQTSARAVAFCGIARPAGFFAMIDPARCTLVGQVEFPDHHPYSGEDIERLVEAAWHAGAEGFVTTAKDAVKLTPAALARLEEVGPVAVAGLRVRLVDEAAALITLRGLIPELRP